MRLVFVREQDNAALHLYELVDDTYVLRSVTSPGEILRIEEPLVVTIDPKDLL